MREPALRALVYLRALIDYHRAVAHCRRRGHRLLGIVHDPDGTRWHEVVRGGLAGQFEIIVIARLSDLPPDRVPRTELVEEPDVEVVDGDDVRPLYRRPRRRG